MEDSIRDFALFATSFSACLKMVFLQERCMFHVAVHTFILHAGTTIYKFRHKNYIYRNTKQPDFCPNDGTPIANIRTVIIDPVNLCRVPVVHFPIQLPQPRGRMGGRAFVGTSSRASSRTPTSRSRTASESSVPGIDVATPESEAGRLMPPPSGTSVRRSIRLTQASTRPPSAAPAPVQQPSEPITRQCHTNHSKHFGIGCASKAANHLPPYYNSLAQVKKSPILYT